jgi:hypothetical protein
LCGGPFKLWMVPDDQWGRLPDSQQNLVICERDYQRLIAAAGHDPAGFAPRYDGWERLVAAWEATQSHPATLVHAGFPRETMWCEIARRTRSGAFVVRLRNDGVTVPYRSGDMVLARWDGDRKSATGRSVLRVTRRMPASRR